MKNNISKNFFLIALIVCLFAVLVFYLINQLPIDNFLASENLILNSSFEDGLNNWQIEPKEFLEVKQGQDGKFDFDLSAIDKSLSFEYFPVKIEGELAKSVIYFEFLGKDDQIFSRLTYVLNGDDDYWFYSNIVQDKMSYLTYIKKTEAGKWNNIKIDNLLNDYNAQAVKIGASLLNIDNLKKITVTLSTWSLGAPVEVKYRKLPLAFNLISDYNDELIDFKKYSKNEPSALKSFLSLPSDGNKFIRVLSQKNNYLKQDVSGLDKTKNYLLFFDAKNEFGLIPPAVTIFNKDGSQIISKELPMKIAQSGWARSGFVFKPNNSSVVIKIDNGDLSNYYYSNNYDNFKLYELVAGSKGRLIKSIEKKYNNIFLTDGTIQDEVLKTTNYVSKDFSSKMKLEYETLGIPVYDLYFNEHDLWDKATFGESGNYWDYGFLGGYKKMLPAKLVMNKDDFNVKIKIRGIMSYHRASRNHSFRVDLSKNERFDLLRPASRSYLAENFSYYLGDKLGLVSMKNDFVFLRVNDKPMGVYWKVSHDAKDLELNKKAEGYLLGVEDGSYIFDRKSDEPWEIYAKPSNKDYIKKYDSENIIRLVTSLLKKNDIENASKLIDVDKLLSWNVHSVLLGSSHQDRSHNNSVYFDTSRGQLEWVPWDVRFNYEKDINDDFSKSEPSESLLFEHYNPFIDEFLTNFDYYNQRNRLLWSYVNSDGNLKEDLTYYDSVYNKTKNAFSKTVDYEAPFNPINSLNIEPYEKVNKIILSQKDIYEKRLQNIKKRFLENNKIEVGLFNTNKKTTYNNKNYDILKIKIRPTDNKAFSSTLVDNVVLSNINSTTQPYLISGGRLIASNKKDNDKIIFPINQFLPSDAFLKYKIDFFWKDHFDHVLSLLKNNSEDLKFLQDQYLFSPDKTSYLIKSESLADLSTKNKIISILQTVGEISNSGGLEFYLIYNEVPDLPQKISVGLKNSITDENITPSIIWQDDGVIPDLAKVLNGKSDELAEKKVIDLGQDYFSNNLADISFDSLGFISKHSIFTRGVRPNQVLLKSGSYEVAEDIIVPQKVELVIEAGTTLKFAKNKSLVSYGKLIAKGAKNKPIIFTAINKNEPWGVIALTREMAVGEFDYCLFEYGGDAYINATYFSGMLSGYFADVIVDHSQFQYAGIVGGDDALNFKNSYSVVKNSYFYENSFDAIDFDFMKKDSEISGNYFLKNGNDGIDISGSEDIIITNNIIENSGDKGISAGERTKIIINNNIISDSNFGIVAKDLSEIDIVNNDIINNNIGIATYNKKKIFGGSIIHVRNTLLKNNKMSFGVEQIDKNDIANRYGKKEYVSSLTVCNSTYDSNTDQVFQEIIKEPSGKIKSKKQFLESYLSNDWGELGYQFAILKDKITAVEPCSNKAPIGVSKKDITIDKNLLFNQDDL